MRRGEILGIAGLVGAGRTETALTLFGALQRSAGEVTLDGTAIDPALARREAKRLGLALIPEDRRSEGLITDLSVRDNLTLASLARWSRSGSSARAPRRRAPRASWRRCRSPPRRCRQLTRNLSGGNQQKVVIGRWFATQAKVYVFDEPTTGVDVGSKVEIYHQMTDARTRRRRRLFISTDFEELLGMCDRIAVMKKGRGGRGVRPRGTADMQRAAPGGDRWSTTSTSAGVTGGACRRRRGAAGLLPAEPGAEWTGGAGVADGGDASSAPRSRPARSTAGWAASSAAGGPILGMARRGPHRGHRGPELLGPGQPVRHPQAGQHPGAHRAGADRGARRRRLRHVRRARSAS